ncbi:uncharacterized protein N7511_000808 [Penicillium nucicola]|uniref:uncharacterized protein n=1 Tax=Penicillium nucicola TaxID=1850975 RepID=UPI0025451B84|nr:uncharacterized protein N7511_000808 [Penicillium nucicola]KAJ5775797.1 hypothetical protein N7511_000808 [Penicillium nucicola]
MTEEADLKTSAQKSLTALHVWCLGIQDPEDVSKGQQNLSPEIESLVMSCQKLRKNGYNNGRDLLATNEILKHQVQSMMEDLTYNSLQSFALLTEHFHTASQVLLPRQLLLFFVEPSKAIDSVCNYIYCRHSKTIKSESVKKFKRRLIELLGIVEYYVVRGKWALYV